MADGASTGFAIGDRSQGYEVTGRASIAGLDAAYIGKDTRDRDDAVTLIWLAENQDQSTLFDASRTYEQLKNEALVGPRTLVRFGAGSAVVVGKEQGAPLEGETLGVWLERRAPLTLPDAARLFLPVLGGLSALHGRGLAHGRISAGQALIGRDNRMRLMAPWLAEGAKPLEQFKRTQAPELISGDQPGPVSDVYSIIALLYWALSGNAAPSADDRLASKAQRDQDPLRPINELVPGLDAELVRAIDTGMRLHPATRPQSIAVLAELLELHASVATPQTSEASAPPPIPNARKTPWGPSNGASSAPPPLPSRSGGVPPIPRSTRTGSIGQTPPPLPQGQSSASGGSKPKRKIGIGTVVTFIVALAVAWVVASGGMFGGNEGTDVEPPRQVENQRETTRPESVEVDNQPRKGPAANAEDDDDDDDDDQAERSPDGVLEQFCNSRFTFETARDAGTNALRAYVRRCNGIDSDFVEDARDALGQ
ncbi:MAG: serine/threonine-protein kinase [Devosiaceae bacterium]